MYGDHLPKLEHKLFIRGQRAHDRAACENLLLHRLLARHAPVLGDAVPYVGGHGPAVLANDVRAWQAVAASAHVIAHAILGFVRLARLIGNAFVFHVVMNQKRVAAVAAWRCFALVVRRNTVDDHLTREHDVRKGGFACHFYPIVERCERAMDPASSAILWNVLVDVGRHVRDTVNIAPVEAGGDVFVGERVLGPHPRHELESFDGTGLPYVPVENLGRRQREHEREH